MAVSNLRDSGGSEAGLASLVLRKYKRAVALGSTNVQRSSKSTWPKWRERLPCAGVLCTTELSWSSPERQTFPLVLAAHHGLAS